MESDRTIHIVEVRSLRMPILREPSSTVDRKKQYLLFKAASAYVRRYRIEKEVSFDIVSVVFDGVDYKVEYIPRAFYPIITY